MRVLKTVAAAAVTALLMAGCSSTTAPEKSGDLEVIKVGLPASANAIAGYMASDRFAEQVGLKLEIVKINSGSEAIPMLLNGQLDVSLGDGLGTITASTNKVPLAIIGLASSVTSDPAQDPTGIFTNDPNLTVKGLSTGSLAITALGGAPELIARAGIDAAGGDSSTVKFIELRSGQMAASLHSKQVSAIFTNEPYTSAAPGEGFTELLRPSSAAFVDLPLTFWITSQSYAKSNEDKVARFLAAVQAGGRQVNADEVSARKLAGTYMEMDKETLAKIQLPYFAENVTDSKAIEKLVGLATRYGFLKTQPDLDSLLNIDHQVKELK